MGKAKKMKKSTGTVYARVEKPVGSGTLQLKMSGVKLTNTEGFLRKSDPFYEFKRKDYGPKGTEWNVVHRSEAVKNNLSPDWKTANIDLGVLSDDDFDKPLMLTIFDHESDGNHVVMGSIETSVNKLVEPKEGRKFNRIISNSQSNNYRCRRSAITYCSNERCSGDSICPSFYSNTFRSSNASKTQLHRLSEWWLRD